MIKLMIISMITFSTLFMFLNHPLSMGLMLLMITIMNTLLSGIMMMNFWYSYMLILIMIGGMLVLFMYMTSIASNEKFKFSMKLNILVLFILTMMSPILFMDSFYLQTFKFSELIIPMNNLSNYLISMNKYLMYPNMLMYFILMIYLLITLIAVVKITKINYGPLRQKF